MSIWTDMIKYNFVNKKIYNNGDGSLTNSIDVETENSLDYKRIATFTSVLDGYLKSITLTFTLKESGSYIANNFIQLRDKDGNVLREQEWSNSSPLSFISFPVKAFKPYEIYFKSDKVMGSGYDIYVPSNIKIVYDVVEQPRYLLLNAN